MIQLRIKVSRRTFQCDVAGCRNRTAYLITKRDDVCSRPLHLCPACIRGLSAILDDLEGEKAVGIREDDTSDLPQEADNAERDDGAGNAEDDADAARAEQGDDHPDAEQEKPPAAPQNQRRRRRNSAARGESAGGHNG